MKKKPSKQDVDQALWAIMIALKPLPMVDRYTVVGAVTDILNAEVRVPGTFPALIRGLETKQIGDE